MDRTTTIVIVVLLVVIVLAAFLVTQANTAVPQLQMVQAQANIAAPGVSLATAGAGNLALNILIIAAGVIGLVALVVWLSQRFGRQQGQGWKSGPNARWAQNPPKAPTMTELLTMMLVQQMKPKDPNKE